jgi:hypothetical protein
MLPSDQPLITERPFHAPHQVINPAEAMAGWLAAGIGHGRVKPCWSIAQNTNHAVPSTTASVGTLGTVCALAPRTRDKLCALCSESLGCRRCCAEHKRSTVCTLRYRGDRGNQAAPSLLLWLPLFPLFDHLPPGGWRPNAFVETTGATRCALALGHKTVQHVQQHL